MRPFEASASAATPCRGALNEPSTKAVLRLYQGSIKALKSARRLHAVEP
jgi:hypothetical protein